MAEQLDVDQVLVLLAKRAPGRAEALAALAAAGIAEDDCSSIVTYGRWRIRRCMSCQTPVCSDDFGAMPSRCWHCVGLSQDAEAWRGAIEAALGTESDPALHTPEWASVQIKARLRLLSLRGL